MPHDVSWPDFTLMKVVCLMFLAFRNVFYNRDWVDFNSTLSKVVVKSRNLGFWAQLCMFLKSAWDADRCRRTAHQLY